MQIIIWEYSAATFIISLCVWDRRSSNSNNNNSKFPLTVQHSFVNFIHEEYMKFIKRDTFRNDKRYWRNFTNGNFPLCYFHHYVMYFPSARFSFIFYWMTHNVAALYEFIWIVADENSIFFPTMWATREMANRNKEKGNLGPENWLEREEIQLFFPFWISYCIDKTQKSDDIKKGFGLPFICEWAHSGVVYNDQGRDNGIVWGSKKKESRVFL